MELVLLWCYFSLFVCLHVCVLGGGVLAHTILGVNFNELMGDVE